MAEDRLPAPLSADEIKILTEELEGLARLTARLKRASAVANWIDGWDVRL